MKKNFILFLSVVLVFALLLSGCAKTSAPTPAPTQAEGQKPVEQPAAYVNNDLLVDADWLSSNLNGLVILDARDEKSYKKNHIPGAINVAWQPFTDMTGKKPGDKGWGTLLPADKLSDVISKLGIDDSKTVVVYGAPPTGWAEDGRIVWTLKMAGLENVKLLNGGFAAWTAKGFSTDNAIPSPTATSFKAAALDESLNTTTDYINQNLGKIKIIDVREAEEYNGATKYGEARGGHLPGAINITWTQLLNPDGTVKSQADLENLLSSNRINKNDEIATYCTKGIRSAHMALVLRMAGYNNTKNYDASFYEWSGNKDLKLDK